MMTLRSFALALFAGAATLLSVGTAPLLAQDSAAVDAVVADPSATIADAAGFEAALVGHERAADRTRNLLAELLAHDDVRALAEARLVDMDRVEERAGTLSDQELAQVESLVTEAAEALDLNSTITISVTTVIIILLLLILLT